MSDPEDKSLICPITSELFRDPVLCVGDGHTYERSAAEKWFASGKNTSPMTGATIKNFTLVPNYLVRSKADEVRGGPAERVGVVANDNKGKDIVPPQQLSAPEPPTTTTTWYPPVPPPSAPGVTTSTARNPQTNAPVGNDPATSELKKWVMAYDVGKAGRGGPHPGQRAAYGWFDQQGWGNQWPLHRAAMHGDIAGIRALTARGNDPNQRMTSWFDSEPLGWAASFGELGAVVALILAGADPLRPPNSAGNTPLHDAQRENHRHVVAFLREYEYRARNNAPAAQVMRAQDIIPPATPTEENWGMVACPVFGHPDWDKGAYNSPLGLCCVRLNRQHPGDLVGETIVGLLCMWHTSALWLSTLCFQPCGCAVGKFPWLGDCPFTEQRVTRNYVAHASCCLTRGPAKDRMEHGLPP